MYAERKSFYAEIEKARGSRVIAYVTGDRRELETRIAGDVLDLVVEHLDRIGHAEKISLVLYTQGGETMAAWSFANLLRSFAEQVEIIVPSKCHSAGTLIALGANTILMTKQATLGPIDPSVNSPLNPQLPGGQPRNRVPVSVEHVNGFIEFARDAVGDSDDGAAAMKRLSQEIHPLVLGQAFRVRSQIRMVGQRLLSAHMDDVEQVDRILNFLCGESGSHDYTINRREARDKLCLPIEKPDATLYGKIKGLYDDIAGELQLRIPYNPVMILGSSSETAEYRFVRGLLESAEGGSHAFVSDGVLTRQRVMVPPGVPQESIQDQRQFEGWRHQDV
jgi:hypothetical protein